MASVYDRGLSQGLSLGNVKGVNHTVHISLGRPYIILPTQLMVQLNNIYIIKPFFLVSRLYLKEKCWHNISIPDTKKLFGINIVHYLPD